MKIPVTGGAGFIGSAVVRQAVAAGHEVVNLDALTYAACLENVASVADSPLYSFEQAGIREELGWHPAVTLQERLRRTVRWYLDNEAWWRPLEARIGIGQRLGRCG